MKKKTTTTAKPKYPKMDTMGDILSPGMVPQPGDPSTQLYANDTTKGL